MAPSFVCFPPACAQHCSSMRLKRSSEKDPIDFNYRETAHRDKRTLPVYLASAVLQYCVRRDQISCSRYYNNNKAKKVLQGLGTFLGNNLHHSSPLIKGRLEEQAEITDDQY